LIVATRLVIHVHQVDDRRSPRRSPDHAGRPNPWRKLTDARNQAMTLELDGPLLLAGAGNMGGAMLAGWLERGLSPARIIVQDPAPPAPIAALLARHAITAVPTVEASTAPPAVLLMAVKPQVMEQVFPPLAKVVGPKTVVLSIAAGRTLASFERHLPAGTAVVRAMPNTPASVGRGITGCVANAHVTPAQRALCQELLTAIGEVVWVEREDLIDAVTAVSGSGPAYAFLLAEVMAKAGEAVGLPADLAAKLARATVAGAGEMLHRTETPAEVLRKNVTSPGGTTAAALAVLMAEEAMQPLMTRAVQAAAQRSRELAG
jgi:pyrroline-5-carboxylate reductase